MNHTVLLYYKYTPIEDTKQLMLDQKALCIRLGLKGRILIAQEGINSTLEGTSEAIETYCSELTQDTRLMTFISKKVQGRGRLSQSLKLKFDQKLSQEIWEL